MTKSELISFEDHIVDLFEAGKLPYPIHFSGGNEDQLIEIFNTEFALRFTVLLSLKAQADDFRKYRHGNTELRALRGGVRSRGSKIFYFSGENVLLSELIAIVVNDGVQENV